MQINYLLRHALKMVAREFSSGEYRLTLFALIVGVTSVMALSLTGSRIQNAMFDQAGDLIGGDLVITSTSHPQPQLLSLVKANKLNYSLSVATTTMVSNKEQFLLSSIRALDDNYPLKEQLVTRLELGGENRIEITGPAKGEAWVERRLLDRLGIALGDQIEIGYASFIASRLLELEPDRGGGFYSFNPRVLINLNDLENTRLIQPGSHIHYKLMLTGQAQDLLVFRTQSANKLTPDQRLLDPKTSQTRVSNNLERASAFINLGSLMAVILCGIAVSLAASRHARRHVNQVALLRCFGLRARQVNMIYLLQLILIAIPAIIVGMIAGYLVQILLIQFIAELFSSHLPDPSISAWLSGPLTAICMVIGFGLPPLLALAQTPPARVLRRELTANKTAPLSSAILALVALTLIAWWQTQNLNLAMLSIGGTIFLVSVSLGIIISLLKLVPVGLIKHPIIRGAYANIIARPTLTAMQIVGFGLSVFAVALILLFRGDLFEQWNQQIPENAPNRFVFDILSTDVPAMQKLLVDNNIQTIFYPTVRGRLVKINNRLVQSAVSKEQTNNNESLNRDLALTQVSALPLGNKIITGEFLLPLISTSSDQIPVSVEAQLAQKLELNLGDKLEFIIEGQSLIATIASLRSVNWDNFRPNFYMIFPKGVLDNYSQNWITSFYLAPGKAQLDKQINQRFTGITMVDVDFILKRIRRILDQVSSAMELTFSMTVLAGLAVFWAALLITFDEKQKQSALLRALGASRRYVRVRFICEQLLIGLLSGLLAAICLAVVSWLVSSQVLEIEWQVPWVYCLSIPVLMMMALCALASFQLNKILNTSPYQTLHQADMA